MVRNWSCCALFVVIPALLSAEAPEEQTPPVNQKSQKRELSPEEKRPVVTVHGTVVRAYQVTPESAPEKKKTLSPEEYRTWLRDYRANWLLYHVCGPVKRKFLAKEKVHPTDEEITEKVRAIMKKHEPYLKSLKKEEIGMRMMWLSGSSREWRTAKAMHEKFGGRVGISSFGACTAIDALAHLVQEGIDAGEITFHDAELQRAFMERVKKNLFTDVVLRPKRVTEHFEVAPWERWEYLWAKEAAEWQAKQSETENDPEGAKLDTDQD